MGGLEIFHWVITVWLFIYTLVLDHLGSKRTKRIERLERRLNIYEDEPS